MGAVCPYASSEMYREVRRRIGEDEPAGMVSDVVFEVAGGLRHIEV